ncbi:hypothetical protein D3C84_634140 [compost metagenome]
MPLMRVCRLRPPQVRRQWRVIPAQAIAAGAHVNRHECIDGLKGRGRIAAGDFQAKKVAILGAGQLQFQGIADHLVIAHDAFEHFTQTAAGHQRITQRMEGRRADET